MIDWDDLRFFLAVGRGGSTSSAARQLGVNQSTAVRRIDALEQSIGLKLFKRRRDGYALTAEGENLLQEAIAVESAVLALTRKASALDDTLSGSLRVTTAEGMAIGLVPQLLQAFHQQHPSIQVSLVISDRYSSLNDGEAEVALRAGPPGDSHLVGRKLCDQSWAIYASQGYIERFGRPDTLVDLDRHRFVGFDGTIEDITPARWLRATAPHCSIVSRSNSVLGLLFAAQSGFGLTLLPCQIGDGDGNLVRVVEPQPGLTAGFWMLTHPDLQHRPKVRAFFAFMVREIRKHRSKLMGQAGGGQRVPD